MRLDRRARGYGVVARGEAFAARGRQAAGGTDVSRRLSSRPTEIGNVRGRLQLEGPSRSFCSAALPRKHAPVVFCMQRLSLIQPIDQHVLCQILNARNTVLRENSQQFYRKGRQTCSPMLVFKRLG